MAMQRPPCSRSPQDGRGGSVRGSGDLSCAASISRSRQGEVPANIASLPRDPPEWNPMPDRIHLSVTEARALSERALLGLGYDAGEARIVADHMLDAALCGYEY